MAIEEFIGRWRATERRKPHMSDPLKDTYYPPVGVKIEFTRADGQSHGQEPEPIEGLRLSVVSGAWDAGPQLANANFWHRDGIVVMAPFVSTIPGDNGHNITITEVIQMESERVMWHTVIWGDGDAGCWACVKD